jgi:hypothetical protein
MRTPASPKMAKSHNVGGSVALNLAFDKKRGIFARFCGRVLYAASIASRRTGLIARFSAEILS